MNIFVNIILLFIIMTLQCNAGCDLFDFDCWIEEVANSGIITAVTDALDAGENLIDLVSGGVITTTNEVIQLVDNHIIDNIDDAIGALEALGEDMDSAVTTLINEGQMSLLDAVNELGYTFEEVANFIENGLEEIEKTMNLLGEIDRISGPLADCSVPLLESIMDYNSITDYGDFLNTILLNLNEFQQCMKSSLGTFTPMFSIGFTFALEISLDISLGMNSMGNVIGIVLYDNDFTNVGRIYTASCTGIDLDIGISYGAALTFAIYKNIDSIPGTCHYTGAAIDIPYVPLDFDITFSYLPSDLIGVGVSWGLSFDLIAVELPLSINFGSCSASWYPEIDNINITTGPIYDYICTDEADPIANNENCEYDFCWRILVDDDHMNVHGSIFNALINDCLSICEVICPDDSGEPCHPYNAFNDNYLTGNEALNLHWGTNVYYTLPELLTCPQITIDDISINNIYDSIRKEEISISSAIYFGLTLEDIKNQFFICIEEFQTSIAMLQINILDTSDEESGWITLELGDQFEVYLDEFEPNCIRFDSRTVFEGEFSITENWYGMKLRIVGEHASEEMPLSQIVHYGPESNITDSFNIINVDNVILSRDQKIAIGWPSYLSTSIQPFDIVDVDFSGYTDSNKNYILYSMNFIVNEYIDNNDTISHILYCNNDIDPSGQYLPSVYLSTQNNIMNLNVETVLTGRSVNIILPDEIEINVWYKLYIRIVFVEWTSDNNVDLGTTYLLASLNDGELSSNNNWFYRCTENNKQLFPDNDDLIDCTSLTNDWNNEMQCYLGHPDGSNANVDITNLEIANLLLNDINFDVDDCESVIIILQNGDKNAGVFTCGLSTNNDPLDYKFGDENTIELTPKPTASPTQRPTSNPARTDEIAGARVTDEDGYIIDFIEIGGFRIGTYRSIYFFISSAENGHSNFIFRSGGIWSEDTPNTNKLNGYTATQPNNSPQISFTNHGIEISGVWCIGESNDGGLSIAYNGGDGGIHTVVQYFAADGSAPIIPLTDNEQSCWNSDINNVTVNYDLQTGGQYIQFGNSFRIGDMGCAPSTCDTDNEIQRLSVVSSGVNRMYFNSGSYNYVGPYSSSVTSFAPNGEFAPF